ncbi:MAG: chalcone isomerase family protein [Pseudomonadota bacterium]
MSRPWLSIVLFMCALAANAALPVNAAPQSDAALVLRGQGTASYLMIDVYEARLYAPADLPARDLPRASAPLRLRLSYKLPLSRDDIIRVTWEKLREQWPQQRIQKIAPALETLHARLRDVDEGDSYTLEYHPEQGMSMWLNDRIIWQGGDAALAEAYFGLWLKQPALSEPLRLALLGQAE